jgi:hypothetical protein
MDSQMAIVKGVVTAAMVRPISQIASKSYFISKPQLFDEAVHRREDKLMQPDGRFRAVSTSRSIISKGQSIMEGLTVKVDMTTFFAPGRAWRSQDLIFEDAIFESDGDVPSYTTDPG